MKLKCISCLFDNSRGIRNAVTIFNGHALCEIHLRKTLADIKKMQQELAKKRKEEEKGKIETAKETNDAKTKESVVENK